MTLKWTDALQIGEELADAHPDVDPLKISFVKLHELVLALPDFKDDPERSNEAILEAILQAWLDERD